jgi:signal transduction histidine kinase/CheY-like chemotaxis protein
MVGWWSRFASAQSWEETQRQYSVSMAIERQGRYLTLLAYAVGFVFLPVWICVPLAVLDTTAQILASRILADVDPPNQHNRYLTMYVLICIAHGTFGMLCVLIYQSENPFAKAYAVGALAISIMQLATVRTVHLPLALLGLGTFAIEIFIGNSYYWVARGDMVGLSISTVAAATGLYFSGLTMLSVHDLHDLMMRDRIAAQAGDRAKSRFLAQMSHELRTPLNAILGMGSAELIGAQNDQSKGRLTTMVESARSLSVLLDDILDMSAAEAGGLPIRPIAINLKREIASAAALFHQQIEDSKLLFNIQISDDVPEYVTMDGQRLRQCLSNLLSNAVKFTRVGGIVLHAHLKGPNLLAIQVADSGPGIPESVQSQIFQPFQRGQTEVAGTGLGLSISRTLARRMGGDLILMPSATGACFQLTFAFGPATAADVPDPKSQPAGKLLATRVLVVDDISSNRLVALTYLLMLGAEAQEAASGDAALAILADWSPDVVLLDMVMPEMDGMSTLNAIRKLPGAIASVPVIAMTADDTDQRRQFYLSSGLDGYLAKPFSAERLSTAIQLALQQPKA